MTTLSRRDSIAIAIAAQLFAKLHEKEITISQIEFETKNTAHWSVKYADALIAALDAGQKKDEPTIHAQSPLTLQAEQQAHAETATKLRSTKDDLIDEKMAHAETAEKLKGAVARIEAVKDYIHNDAKGISYLGDIKQILLILKGH